jgi:uncharacterized protein YbjQ (UPF0145 family)
MTLYSVDTLSGREVREGGLVTAYAVTAANLIKDVREKLTNTFGGRMARYEALVEDTVDRALARLEENAREQGYDGCLAVRIAHPNLVDGGVEVVVYGTGFNFVDSGSDELD